MEWRKIRNWLLLMLLAADLVLAGNLAWQLLRGRQAERQAVLDAVAVAAARGVELDREEVLRLPAEMTGYSARRSDALEQAAANALLGGETLQEGPGGGVSIYRAGAGQLSFRRGGAVELDVPWQGGALNGESCVSLLEKAGFSMKNVLTEQQDGGVVLIQSHEGYPVVNSRLTCLCREGVLQARGRWLLAQPATEGSGSLNRAQLVLALCDLLESQEAPRPERLQAGYYLQSEDAQTVTLVPVWTAETGEGQIIMSCLTGKQLNF